jgi:hypothetical protein
VSFLLDPPMLVAAGVAMELSPDEGVRAAYPFRLRSGRHLARR